MNLYNAIVGSDPSAVIAAMRDYTGGPFTGEGPCFIDLGAAPAGIARTDFDLSRLSVKEALRGQACVLQGTLRMPSATFIVSGAGQFLLVWTDYGCAAGTGRVLGFGMIEPLPSNIGSAEGRVDIECYCRKADWQRLVRAEMKEEVSTDEIFYDQDTGPTTADLMAASTIVPTIDRRSLGVVLRQSFAPIDADSSRPPGNIAQSGVIAYDVTDYVLMNGFMLRKGSSVPIRKLSTKMSVAWNQYWSGTCDITGDVKIAFGAISNGGVTLITYSPNDAKASLPRPGQQLGTGWIAHKANFLVADYDTSFLRSTSEPQVADALSKGYDVMASGSPLTTASDGTGYVLYPAANITPQLGGVVLWGEYTQARRESIVMSSTISLDGRFLGGLPAMQGAKVALADPTVPMTGTAWLPDTPYAQDDIAWYGGLRQFCLVDHVSGEEFDQSKWAAESPDPSAAVSGFGAYLFQGGAYYQAGFCVFTPTLPGTYWYRNKTGNSSPTLLTSEWTQGPAPRQAMLGWKWEYLNSDRGSETINHLDQRHYAALMNAARCVEAVGRLRFNDVLDVSTGLLAIDLTVGMCLRIRTSALVGGVNEVVGVITDLDISMGPHGAGAVSFVLGLVPGTGMNDPAATTELGVTQGTYTYGQPRIPVDVTNLSNPGYVVRQCTMRGAPYYDQHSKIQDAIASAEGGDQIPGKILNALPDAYIHRLQLSLQPLVQEGLITLSHPTMTMKPKAAPRNIEFAS